MYGLGKRDERRTKPDNLSLVLDNLKTLAFEDDAFDLGSGRDEIIEEYNAVHLKEESLED